MIAVVVAPKPLADVLEAAAAHQVAGGGVDGRAGIADVAPVADARLRPSAGEKLHGTVGVGHRHPIDPPHAALHQVHRGQHLPGDARGGGGLAVVAQQVGGGFRWSDPPGGQVGRPPARIVHGDEFPPGPDVSIEHRPPALGQGGSHPIGLLRLVSQHPVDHLLLVAQSRQVRRGGGLRPQGLLHLGDQAGSGSGVRWHQGVMAAVGSGGQTGPGG